MIEEKSINDLLFNVEERTKERIKVILHIEHEARQHC